jgi:hypothetical protein
MLEKVQFWIDSVQSALDKGWTLDETINKITMVDKYPRVATEPMIDGIRKRSLQHLYEVLKK